MSAIIHEGDCLDVMPTLPSASVDAVIADPPYGTTENRWDSPIALPPLWEMLARIARRGAPVVLFAAQPFASALVMSNPGWYRYEWVWEKTKAQGFMNVRYAPLRAHENVLVFCEHTPPYNPQMGEGRPYRDTARPQKMGVRGERQGLIHLPIENAGTRYPRSVQRFPNPNHGSLHPTQKPVPLLEYLIRTYTNAGDTVLDFTCGSGTTGVACINTGRHFIGIERESNYVAIARQRLAAAEASRQPALFAAD